MILLNIRYGFSVPPFRNSAHICPVHTFCHSWKTLSLFPHLLFRWLFFFYMNVCYVSVRLLYIQVFLPLINFCSNLSISFLTWYCRNYFFFLYCCVLRHEFPCLCTSSFSDIGIYLCAFLISYLIFLIYNSSDFVFFWCNFVCSFLLILSFISDVMSSLPSPIGQFYWSTIVYYSFFPLDFSVFLVQLHEYSLIYFHICPQSSPISSLGSCSIFSDIDILYCLALDSLPYIYILHFLNVSFLSSDYPEC